MDLNDCVLIQVCVNEDCDRTFRHVNQAIEGAVLIQSQVFKVVQVSFLDHSFLSISISLKSTMNIYMLHHNVKQYGSSKNGKHRLEKITIVGKVHLFKIVTVVVHLSELKTETKS